MSDILQQLSDAMAGVVEQLSPAIVTVDGRRRLPATGVIHSADGLIVTAHHVVESDEGVGIITSDGKRHTATLIGRDPHNDLAVLRVNASDLPTIPWADDDALKVGHLVLALGRPMQQVQATLGVVSATVSGQRAHEIREEMRSRREQAAPEEWRRFRREMRRARRQRMMGRALADGYIATDVVMYPGFSGGPLVSGDGRVHGLNTSGFGQGMSISVPVATIRQTASTLLAHGRMRQGFLGVGVQPVRLPAGIVEDQETGLVVISVESDSPAANAGLIVGDIIVALDNEPTADVDELLGLLTGDRVGQSVAIDIVRGGSAQQMNVTIAERA